MFVVREKIFDFKCIYIMGILNVTPDSFFDGGKYFDYNMAIEKSLKLIEEGADIIDIGGESTRPGSEAVSEEEELDRVLPVIEGIRKYDKNIVLSIDTYKAKVAEFAIDAGCDIVNDISGGIFDNNMFKIVAEKKAPYILMHIKGTPKNMQDNPKYSEKGVVFDIKEFFKQRIDLAIKSGIDKNKIILDPGIGFGKTLIHNIEILNNLEEFKKLGFPVLVGTSRKSLIGKILKNKPEERLYGTLATVVFSIIKGANIVRVHDVKETKDVVKITETLINYKNMEIVDA